MKYRSVFFDLGNTLVRTDHAAMYASMLRAFDVAVDETAVETAFYLADKTFMRQYPHVLGSHPSTFMPWYLGVLNYHLGVKLDLHDCHQRYRQQYQATERKWRAVPGAMNLLRKLKAVGIGTGLVSNWDHSCRAVLAETGLDALLDVIVVSSEVGIEKPDPRIFQLAMQSAGTAPEQCLYVGDNYYDDVIGARNAGMNCLLIAPYGKLGLEEVEHDLIIAELGEVEKAIG